MFRRLVRGPRPAAGDRGFSLVEVMVGAAVMSVVMGIATAGFVQMYQATAKADTAAQAQAALSDAFAKLDREVRYAYRVNAAYQIGTDSYAVDYLVNNGVDPLLCVQLTLPIGGGALVRRQWPESTTSADPAAVSTGVANDLVTAAEGVNPFTVKPAGTEQSNFDRLLVNLNGTVGVGAGGSVRNYNLQFTALNTTVNDESVPTLCTKA
jgi:prepilin-type N-terminal cleavage/methylation domain-containing protein